MRTIFARLDNDARRVVKDDEEEEEEVLEQDDRRTLVVVSYARDAARDVSMCASRCVARVRMVQLSNTICPQSGGARSTAAAIHRSR